MKKTVLLKDGKKAIVTSNLKPCKILGFFDLTIKQQKGLKSDIEELEEIENNFYLKIGNWFYTLSDVLRCDSMWIHSDVNLVEYLQKVTDGNYGIGLIQENYSRQYLGIDSGMDCFVIFNVTFLD